MLHNRIITISIIIIIMIIKNRGFESVLNKNVVIY